MVTVELQAQALMDYIVEFMKANEKVFDAMDYHQNKTHIIEFMTKKGLILGLLDKYVDDRPFMNQPEDDDRINLDVLMSVVMDRIVVNNR